MLRSLIFGVRIPQTYRRLVRRRHETKGRIGKGLALGATATERAVIGALAALKGTTVEPPNRPPELWFKEGPGDEPPTAPNHKLKSIAGRVGHLFDVFRNPKTGKPYTNAEVVSMTLGDLSEEGVEGVRTGSIPDPTVC